MKYFSLFTGIGGLDHGLEKMGAECVGFSEIRESSMRIYGRHYPDHVKFGDVTKLDLANLPDFDVLTGGFPCQSFSLAGLRKGFDDRRGQMIFYIYDIIMAKRPKFVVLENVKGILTHDGGRTYISVFKALQAGGYFVRCVLLNASHYGSAQGRERVVFLCSTEDFPAKRPEIRDNKKRFRDVRAADGWDIMPEKKVAGIFPGRVTYAERKSLNAMQMSPFELIGGYDKVGTLLTARYGDARRPKIAQEADGTWRYISLLEAERLQNFPDGWTEGEKPADRWFAIGNAVNCAMSEYLFTDYLKGLWW